MDNTQKTHRSGTLKAAQHIIENSTADPISKITAALIVLYPDDIKMIETRLLQALKEIENKA